MSNLISMQVSKLAEAFSIPNAGDLTAVLKATAFKGQVSDSQMSALLIVANQYGLNPWTREIYAFPDKNNGIVPVVGVDGWSRIINENSQFDGIEFTQDDESCTCTIYRKDRSHPMRVTEYLSECKRSAAPWQSHPKRMLRHKAMIQCARLAFGYVGIYDQDEAERITEPTSKYMGVVDIAEGELVDVEPIIKEALDTKTLVEARNFWKENNGKLAKQPGDHARFKQVFTDHANKLKEIESKNVVEVTVLESNNDDFVAAMDSEYAKG